MGGGCAHVPGQALAYAGGSACALPGASPGSQAVASATFRDVTSKSVRKLLPQVALPSGSAVPTSGRVMRSALRCRAGADRPSAGTGGGVCSNPGLRSGVSPAAPCRCSTGVLWPDGLHTRMKLPSAVPTASRGGRRVYRSSPKRTVCSPTMDGPTRAGRRRADKAVDILHPAAHTMRRAPPVMQLA